MACKKRSKDKQHACFTKQNLYVSASLRSGETNKKRCQKSGLYYTPWHEQNVK
jgi:hypothetical protein